MTVKVRDRGARRLLRTANASRKGPHVDVGVVGTRANAHREAEGLTVAELAEIHEFGLGVPERSWLRAWVDSNSRDVFRVMRALEKRVLQGRLTQEQALGQLGAWIAGQIQQNIANRIPPPNAQSTVNAKGSNVPLIDTGQLRSSITHKVRR